VAGIDTQTAEQMIAHQCGVTLPRGAGSNYISLLDECGGHTTRPSPPIPRAPPELVTRCVAMPSPSLLAPYSYPRPHHCHTCFTRIANSPLFCV
jgi:hypothetical protein